MKCVYLLTLGVFLVVLTGCKSRGNGADVDQNTLVGTWETQSLTVKIPGKGSNKNSVVTLFPLPDTTRKDKPLTVLAQDGKYREMVVDGNGETSSSREGFWNFYQDTLVVRMESEGRVETKFAVQRKGNKLILTNNVDWTADGKKEEEMRLELTRR